MRLPLARTALMALTAIGMIWTTTAHAAPFDNDTAAVYGNPVTDPGHPTVPGTSGQPIQFLPDLKTTDEGDKTVSGVVTWTFRVENLGPVTAHNVWVRRWYNVWVQEVGTGHYKDVSVVSANLGDMAPGTKKDVQIVCIPSAGQTCHMSSAQALLNGQYHADANPKNDWAASWMGK
jgi:hypothetical protein